MKRTATKIKPYTFYSTLVGDMCSFVGVDLEDAIKGHIRHTAGEEDLNIDLKFLDVELTLLADGDVAKIYMVDDEYFTERDLEEIEAMMKKSSEGEPFNITIYDPDFFKFVQGYLYFSLIYK